MGIKLRKIITATIGNKYLSTDPFNLSPNKKPADIKPIVQM